MQGWIDYWKSKIINMERASSSASMSWTRITHCLNRQFKKEESREQPGNSFGNWSINEKYEYLMKVACYNECTAPVVFLTSIKYKWYFSLILRKFKWYFLLMPQLQKYFFLSNLSIISGDFPKTREYFHFFFSKFPQKISQHFWILYEDFTKIDEDLH